jgi:SAM-dependent methyltransferase
MLGSEAEDAARLLLRKHFAAIYKDRLDSYVEGVLAKDHYVDRFRYLQAVIGTDVFVESSKILISGFGAGSEMIIAREFGFGEVHGVEVENIWVETCNTRLSEIPDMYPRIYDGGFLPYSDGEFHVLMSGHIIEHTFDPQHYLNESLRVLKHGGYMFLEFPTRYFYRELHTGLPSFEWLPSSLRDGALRVLSSKYSPLSQDVKLRYHSIFATKLKQISMGSVRRMLRNSATKAIIMGQSMPVLGVIRCVIQKQSDAREN